MAWTSPRTWVAGETVTAALLNTHVRDNLKAVGDAWTSYTPTWGSSGTQPAVGNGTIVGAYMQAGKLVHARVTLTMGSTTTYGTGNYTLTLPVAAKAARRDSGWVDIVDASAASSVTGRAVIVGSTAYLVSSPLSAGSYDRAMTPTVPITWTTNDSLDFSITYEAA